MIRVKINTANRRSTRRHAILNDLSSYAFLPFQGNVKVALQGNVPHVARGRVAQRIFGVRSHS